MRTADFVVLAPPAQHMRAVTQALRPQLARGTPVVSCSKGIERGTAALMSQVLAETLPERPVAVHGGPCFAREIAADPPTGVTLAERLGVDMPIVHAVDRLLDHRADLDQVIDGLLALPFGVQTAVVPVPRRGGCAAGPTSAPA